MRSLRDPPRQSSKTRGPLCLSLASASFAAAAAVVTPTLLTSDDHKPWKPPAGQHAPSDLEPPGQRRRLPHGGSSRHGAAGPGAQAAPHPPAAARGSSVGQREHLLRAPGSHVGVVLVVLGCGWNGRGWNGAAQEELYFLPSGSDNNRSALPTSRSSPAPAAAQIPRRLRIHLHLLMLLRFILLPLLLLPLLWKCSSQSQRAGSRNGRSLPGRPNDSRGRRASLVLLLLPVYSTRPLAGIPGVFSPAPPPPPPPQYLRRHALTSTTSDGMAFKTSSAAWDDTVSREPHLSPFLGGQSFDAIPFSKGQDIPLLFAMAFEERHNRPQGKGKGEAHAADVHSWGW